MFITKTYMYVEIEISSFAGGSGAVLPGGPAVPGRVPAGVPTINNRWLCYSGK